MKIRVEGLRPEQAHEAIGAAFEEIAQVHRLMSFHTRESDISLLNREASVRPVPVHRWTLDVLRQALVFSAATDGCFDITIGAELVEWGILPRPAGAVSRPAGDWRDILILSGGSVKFRRPVWIDFGGIAKGYAVDRAIACLRRRGARRAVVNAGGDIRVSGARAEPIILDPGVLQCALPVLGLADGSVAGSGSERQRLRPHVDGVSRAAAPEGRFVCVVAERCMVADALTKVVMAQGSRSAPHLRRFGATACLHDPGDGWRSIGKRIGSMR
ncbi:MAG TPA: FAD:protein FMN transferase [Bryobacteraceae bacterium]|nr:FAD:protein FMN transferase [Bryobacteraceae bacterium]